MGLSYRAKGLLGFFGWTGLGIGVWLGLSWTEDSRREKIMEYYKSHPDELDRMQEHNAQIMAIIKKAAQIKEKNPDSSEK